MAVKHCGPGREARHSGFGPVFSGAVPLLALFCFLKVHYCRAQQSSKTRHAHEAAVGSYEESRTSSPT
jgi:hypothetical protein